MELERCSIPWPSNWRFFDTLTKIRKMDVTLEKYNLSYLYQHFTGSFLENAHQSIADCRALERVFYESKMPQKLNPVKLKTYEITRLCPAERT